MKVKFNQLETQTGTLKYSFDNGITTSVISTNEALKNGIPIDPELCVNLSDIILFGSYIKATPKAEQDIIKRYSFCFRGIELQDLADTLKEYKGNTPDDPLLIKVRPAKKLWTHDELVELNNIINTSEVYVDISPTNLNHEIEQHLIDVCYDVEFHFWGNTSDFSDFDGNYEGKDYSEAATFTELYIDEVEGLDSNSRALLKVFPSVFTHNTYLVGLTFPSNDNFTVTMAMNEENSNDRGNYKDETFEPPFEGCTNLKHIHFSGNGLYKIGIYNSPNQFNEHPDDYYLWEGQENFKRMTDDWITILESEDEFIDKLVNHKGSIMDYYYWVDYEQNPTIHWKEGFGPTDASRIPSDTDVIFEGVKNVPNVNILSLQSEIPVNEINLSTPNQNITTAVATDFGDTKAESINGVLYLDGAEN